MFLLLICLTFSTKPFSKRSYKRTRFPIENKKKINNMFPQPKGGCPAGTHEFYKEEVHCLIVCISNWVPYCYT